MGVVFALREGDFARASMLLDIPADKLRALAGVSEETSKKVSQAVGDISAGGEQALGRFTSIVREAEGAGATGKELAENLKKGLSPAQINALLSGLGASDAMMEKVSDSMIGQLQKLQNHWLTFRQTVGVKVLDALAGPLDRLLTWLEENEEMVTRIAEAFGDFIANGIEKLVTWLDDDGFDKMTAWLEDLPAKFDAVMKAAEPLLNFLSGIVGGAGGKAPETFMEAAGQAVTPGGRARAQIVAEQAGGIMQAWITRLFGGTKEAQAQAALPLHLGRGAGNIFTKEDWRKVGGGRQEVLVRVGVDPRNGSLMPYVQNEIGRNNREIGGGLPGGNNYGWGY
jgi:hypothetical protein